MWACRVHDRAWNPDRSWSQARQDTKTGEPHSAVPDFPVYTTISLTARSMKEQHAYTHTHIHTCTTAHAYIHTHIHTYTTAQHTCIHAYRHICTPPPYCIPLSSPLLYHPLLSSTTAPSPLVYCVPLSSPLLYPPFISYSVSPSPLLHPNLGHPL